MAARASTAASTTAPLAPARPVLAPAIATTTAQSRRRRAERLRAGGLSGARRAQRAANSSARARPPARARPSHGSIDARVGIVAFTA